MKTVTVRYFALFREQAGIDEETLTVEADTAGDI
jgi:molybdopterin converting factor small subunit